MLWLGNAFVSSKCLLGGNGPSSDMLVCAFVEAVAQSVLGTHALGDDFVRTDGHAIFWRKYRAEYKALGSWRGCMLSFSGVRSAEGDFTAG